MATVDPDLTVGVHMRLLHDVQPCGELRAIADVPITPNGRTLFDVCFDQAVKQIPPRVDGGS
eukprot:2835787-Prymnesium_polylepis.1